AELDQQSAQVCALADRRERAARKQRSARHGTTPGVVLGEDPILVLRPCRHHAASLSHAAGTRSTWPPRARNSSTVIAGTSCFCTGGGFGVTIGGRSNGGLRTGLRAALSAAFRATFFALAFSASRCFLRASASAARRAAAACRFASASARRSATTCFRRSSSASAW